MSITLLRHNLILEGVSVEDINSAIDNHVRVIINYDNGEENSSNGSRVIEVYTYGLTKAGNPAIRAFQPYGDTSSKVPSWKLFRIDRINGWEETKQKFSEPASNYYSGVGEYNEDGDGSMSVVYKSATFGDGGEDENKGLNVFKTDTEKRMERLRQQVNNPITVNDLKNKNRNGAFNTDSEKQIDNLKKQDKEKEEVESGETTYKTPEERELERKADSLVDDHEDDEVFKTDTEKRMERLRQQLNNPTYLNNI